MTSKKILIGLTGGIACYKIPILVRRLKDAGHEVRVVMTSSSLNFITELTMQAVSGHPVSTLLLDESQEAAMGHIALARWADLILIAPATAHFMAQLTHGMCGDLLSTLCLATNAPIAIAPAMNQQMWQNRATASNLETLVKRGIIVWGPALGLQACGENGPGRMVEPELLVKNVQDYFGSAAFNSEEIDGLSAERGSLQGLTVLITAGPTVEDLDPVRYLSNRSSGKMGFALAQAAAKLGAQVTLITGPVSLPTPSIDHNPIKRIDVRSAKDMFAAVMRESCDIFIGAAAVSDYRPKEVSAQKLKKIGLTTQTSTVTETEEMHLCLVKNPDIIRWVAGQHKKPFCVGFAAETEHPLEYGLAKLKAKNLDMIAINSVLEAGVGFEVDTNAITLVWKDGKKYFSVEAKEKLAEKLIGCIREKFNEKHSVKDH